MHRPFFITQNHGSRRRICVVLAVLLFVQSCWVGDASGFGKIGHRAIAQIAERHLSARARAAVKAILGNESLAEVSTYADEIRSDPKFDYAKSWHYVNIDDGKTYETAPRNPSGDAIESIQRFTKTLQSTTAKAEERVFALKWLVHLVGDIHQPLHVGRADDRGGNKIRCTWFGKNTNVHIVWDSKIIESTKLSYSEFAKVCDKATAEQTKEWQNSTVLDWANESFKLRTQAYKPPISTTQGSYRYSYDNLPIVKRRVNQAGIRLAGLLNEIYNK